MGIFDKLFQPYTAQPPQEVAPDVSEVKPMTCHSGQVIDANLLLWVVHYRMIDTITNRIIYDKYYEEETEQGARRLYNQLRAQPLKGECISSIDYWGEHARQDFQKAVDSIRLKMKEQYQQDITALASRHQAQTRKQERRLADLQKNLLEYKQENARLLQALQGQEQEHQHRQEQEQFQREVNQAANNVLRVLTAAPHEQAQEARRLASNLRAAGIEQGPDGLRLIAYYLAPLLKD
jgi:hypothetical protein